MTMAERNNKLKHLITCLKCEVRGKSCDVNCPTQYDAGNMGEIIENLEVISKALDQEPSGDLISRQAVLKIIDGWYEQNRDTENIEDLIVLITYMDSVNPQEQKTGRWIADVFVDECSVCGEQTLFFEDQHKNFCPNCGAKMESEVSE